MARRTLTIEQVLAVLTETPRRLTSLTAGLQRAQLHTAPPHDEWTANDVLAHLRSRADVWGSAIATLLAKDHPTIRAISPRTYINTTSYPEQEFRASLRAFVGQRAALLAVLNPLPCEGWARAATVTGVGRPAEWTVLSYGQRMAGHERAHVKQVERTVAALRAAA